MRTATPAISGLVQPVILETSFMVSVVGRSSKKPLGKGLDQDRTAPEKAKNTTARAENRNRFLPRFLKEAHISPVFIKKIDLDSMIIMKTMINIEIISPKNALDAKNL